MPTGQINNLGPRRPSPEVAYVVTATIPETGLAEEFLEWLVQGHIQDVMAAGAIGGHAIRLSDPSTPIRVQAVYRFPNRDALDSYLTNHAPRLRADGLRRFPPERGIIFERMVGEFVPIVTPASRPQSR
jgi:hypothetical protein